MRKICVLGAGSWGTALALVLASNDYNVSMWTLNKDQSKYINEYKEVTTVTYFLCKFIKSY